MNSNSKNHQPRPEATRMGSGDLPSPDLLIGRQATLSANEVLDLVDIESDAGEAVDNGSEIHIDRTSDTGLMEGNDVERAEDRHGTSGGTHQGDQKKHPSALALAAAKASEEDATVASATSSAADYSAKTSSNKYASARTRRSATRTRLSTVRSTNSKRQAAQRPVAQRVPGAFRASSSPLPGGMAAYDGGASKRFQQLSEMDSVATSAKSPNSSRRMAVAAAAAAAAEDKAKRHDGFQISTRAFDANNVMDIDADICIDSNTECSEEATHIKDQPESSSPTAKQAPPVSGGQKDDSSANAIFPPDLQQPVQPGSQRIAGIGNAATDERGREQSTEPDEARIRGHDDASALTGSDATGVGGVLSSANPLVAELVPSTEDVRSALRQEVRQEWYQEQQAAGNAVIQAEPMTSSRDKDQDRKSSRFAALSRYRRPIIALGVFILMVVIALVVLFLVDADKTDGGSDTTQESTMPPTDSAGTSLRGPTTSPSPSPMEGKTEIEELFEILEPLLAGPPTFTNTSVLSDEDSVAYQTLDWMANSDDQTKLMMASFIVPSQSTSLNLLDRYVLTFLYLSMGGAAWVNQFNFLTNATVCDWNDGQERVYDMNGIRCDQFGLVDDLVLFDNNLVGSLPSEIYHLNLQNILVHGNPITGTISSHIGQLDGLLDLRVSDTLLTGSIPTEIGLLGNLMHLFANDSRMGGTIPTEIGGCARLLDLDLSGSRIGGTIPTEIGMLAKLSNIDLLRMSLEGPIPSEIGGVTSLKFLELTRSGITGTIPSEIGNCRSLEEVMAFGNGHSGSIPSEIGWCDKLIKLQLHSNALTGSLPSEIGQLTDLTSLSLKDNKLDGTLPTEVAKMVSLTSVFLQHNLITGNLDPIFCALEEDDLRVFEAVWSDCAADATNRNSGLPRTACSCCDTCCEDRSTVCHKQASQPEECGGRCVMCGAGVYAPACGECLSVEANRKQLCERSCSFATTEGDMICETRTEFENGD